MKYTLKELVLALGLCLLCAGGIGVWQWGVQAGELARATPPQPGAARSIAELLNSEGTLKRAALRDGSYDVRGYRLAGMAGGMPRFVQTTPSCCGWDTQFGLGEGTGNAVRALAVIGNDLYLGGLFKLADNMSANSIARFNTQTGAWSTLGSGGGNGVDGPVLALAASGTDLYVGGGFFTANVGGTTSAANSVAKFDTQTNTWSALGSVSGNGVFGNVLALAVSGTDLYVGGDFTTANVGVSPVAANRLAKFDTQTNTWSALGAGGGNGVNSNVTALAVNGNDLYVGGAFTTTNVGGTTVAANRVAKFDTQTSTWSALGAGSGNGVNSTVNALAVNGTGLYVGGSFTTANVGGTTVAANRVAKFDTQTSTWSALGSGSGNGVNSTVSALAVSGTDLYVGGFFLTANVGVSPIAANRVAKFNMQTSTWGALGAGAGNGVDSVSAGSGISALAVSGYDTYVGGAFGTANIGGATVSANNVARFNTQTSSWSALGAGSGNGVNGNVQVLAVLGTDLYMGGAFTRVGNVAANNIARFNTQTSTWSTLGTGAGNGTNSSVFALVALGTDLYVGGGFTTANAGGVSVPTLFIARFNTQTSTWSALGSGGGNGVNNSVSELAVNGTDLYVGGGFTTANVGVSSVAANRVAKFDTQTSTWSALGSGGGNGVNSNVNDLVVLGSDLYVGGSFTTANVGVSPVAANRVAKFNLQTSSWSALGAGGGNGVNSSVFALAVSGADLYVGGSFTTANIDGATVSANRVVRFNTQTSTWSTLGSGGGNGVGGGPAVSNLLALGPDLYLTGNFTTANVGGATVSANRVVRFNTQTNTWNALADSGGGNGVNNPILALAVSGDSIYVGGIFGLAGDNKPSANLARYCNTPPTITAQAAVLRQQGSLASNTAIATVNDAETAAANLTVTVNGGALATVNGVTVANLVNTNGTITADVGASCAATTSTFSLTVTDAGGLTATANLTITVEPNTPPTISGATISAQKGSVSATHQVATVNDLNQTKQSLSVQINGGASATLAGVTVGNLSVDSAGNVSASVTATCDAATETLRTFTLTVTDVCGLSASSTLTVNLIPNTKPLLSYNDQTVAVGGMLTVNPASGPSDNGAFIIEVDKVQPKTGLAVAVHPVTGVLTLSNITKADTYKVDINITDNCNHKTSAKFKVTVTEAAPATANSPGGQT